jgi:hypothetical protein
MLRSDIIHQLNEADGAGPGRNFLYFLPSYPIDVRLSFYRADTDWCIVMESLTYWVLGVEGHLSARLCTYCFGNDLLQVPGLVTQESGLTADGPSGSLFDPDDIMQTLISAMAKDMLIRHKIVPITTDPAEYAAVGIELKQPPRILGYELLRLVAPKYRRLFFAPERDVVEVIGKPMPLLLRLDEWLHPDRDKGETPADSESFQMIADVIVHNDPSLYQPRERPNTHWSNWPLAGTML